MIPLLSNRIRVSVLILVALAAANACDSNKIREARKAAFRIQVVTNAAVDTTITLHNDRVITDTQTLKIATALKKVNDGNRVFIEKAEAAKHDSASTRADLVAQLRVVSKAVQELKALGILGIKSQSGELAFQSAISALDASLAIIESALEVK